MFRKLWNHFKKTVIDDNRGELSTAMALLYGSLISGAGGIAGGLMSGDGETTETTLKYEQLPDYEESTGARKNWWQTLQDWGKSGNYGATDMNWDEIFNTSKEKLNRYYWGGVNDTGLAGKVKASAARRGVSQSPALENQLGALGQQQSLDLSDLMTNLTTQKATYTESARKTWLQSLMNLAGLKPSYISTGNISNTSSNYDLGDAVTDTTSAAGSALSSYAQSSSLEKLLEKLLSGNETSQSSVLDISKGGYY